MLIQVKNKELISYEALYVLAVRFVFDEAHMTLSEIHKMQDAVITWSQKLDLDRTMGWLDPDEEALLLNIGKFLQEKEEGKWEDRRKLFIDKHIDYRKAFNLPGCRTVEDIERAKVIGAESNRREGIE